MIRNRKTVDPRDKESTPVFQLETAMGAAIECFDGAAAIEVPRTRFAPVKIDGGPAGAALGRLRDRGGRRVAGPRGAGRGAAGGEAGRSIQAGGQPRRARGAFAGGARSLEVERRGRASREGAVVEGEVVIRNARRVASRSTAALRRDRDRGVPEDEEGRRGRGDREAGFRDAESGAMSESVGEGSTWSRVNGLPSAA